MKKCIECGENHRNSRGTKEIGDRCFNCESMLKTFWIMVDALNRHKPIMGKPRKLTILKYKIEKVK